MEQKYLDIEQVIACRDKSPKDCLKDFLCQMEDNYHYMDGPWQVEVAFTGDASVEEAFGEYLNKKYFQNNSSKIF